MSNVNNYVDTTEEVTHVIVDGVIMTYEEWLEMRKAEMN